MMRLSVKAIIKPRVWRPRGALFSTIPNAESSQSQTINREEIIRKALPYVKEYGWNDECLVQAVKELNLPPLTHRIVTRGAAEMVQQVLQDKLAHVRQSVNDKYPDTSSLNTFDGDRLRFAIESHLDFLQPYHPQWSEALAVSLAPSELPYTTNAIFQLSDDLCHFSGIRATRMDWYYERAVVTALYSAIELFFLTDQSANCEETKAFLNNSLEYYRNARTSPLAMREIFWKMARK